MFHASTHKNEQEKEGVQELPKILLNGFYDPDWASNVAPLYLFICGHSRESCTLKILGIACIIVFAGVCGAWYAVDEFLFFGSACFWHCRPRHGGIPSGRGDYQSCSVCLTPCDATDAGSSFRLRR